VDVAVVGSGISGMTSAWLLARRHTVHLFEREPRLGGHTHTVPVHRADGSVLGLDTGFLVYNERTYPLLTRLLDELDVATQPSDMSWSLTCRRCDLEYAGSRQGFFADRRRVADPRHLRMLADILRFNRLGRRLVRGARQPATTLGRFVAAAGFGAGFRDHYLYPMVAAIWSSGTGDVERFDLAVLLRFLDNHGLLGVSTHHRWRSITGGSATYLPRLAAPLAGRIHMAAPVSRIVRDADGVELSLPGGQRRRFDAVVLACHADQALALLADPSPAERELLGAWYYRANDTYLHTDTDLLPKRRSAWASWNYLLDDCRVPSATASLSYHLNRLQQLDEPEEYVVTLNPARPPRPEHVRLRLDYRHPSFVRESVATQPELDRLNGRQRTYFVGAYQRNAFHEDGVFSAVRMASHLGIRWPT